MRARANALLWLLGIGVTVAAFVSAVRGVEQNQNMVADLVRVPAGCATTVDVSEAGTFFVYVERKGRVATIEGCDNGARTYESEVSPEVDVEVRDGSGTGGAIDDDDSVSYSTPEGVGESILRVEVTEAGTFVIEVRSSDPSAVVAVGPDVAVERNRLVLIAVVGVLIGLLMMAIALIGTVRRRRRTVNTGPVVSYGTATDEPTLTWAPPRPEDRAPER